MVEAKGDYLPPPHALAAHLMAVARTEWGIENGLHHRRDVTLREDACPVRRGHAPQVLSAVNNVVIGIVQRAGQQNLAAAQRAFRYAFDHPLAHRSTR
ncbi:transposase [Chloroflexales bacterium ZM16-3]|nr:transposase [Chloroflexales bacterium ZM16-3]